MQPKLLMPVAILPHDHNIMKVSSKKHLPCNMAKAFSCA